jgi:hypothetical protein
MDWCCCAQVAWAPGRGVKGREWKDYWEAELGVSYLPWGALHARWALSALSLDALEDGGAVDEDTLPPWLPPRVSQSQYSLFSLCMFTYTYERQDMMQIALKRLPNGGGGAQKKGTRIRPLTLYPRSGSRHIAPIQSYDRDMNLYLELYLQVILIIQYVW